jgi:hypothetical protein
MVLEMQFIKKRMGAKAAGDGSLIDMDDSLCKVPEKAFG